MGVKFTRSLQCAGFRLLSWVQPLLHERTYTRNRTHPRHWLAMRRWEERDKTVMWLEINPPTNVPKAFIRGWCVRRVRNAFREVLRERGFDGHGRPLKSDAEPQAHLPQLHGTAEFQTKAKIIHMRRNEILEELRPLVDDIHRCSVGQGQPLPLRSTSPRLPSHTVSERKQ